MKKLVLITLSVIVLHFSLSAQTNNKLTPKEEQEGWKLLFNGTNTDGWHAYLKSGAGAWTANGGILQLDNKQAHQGDLLSDKEYENFDLKLEWLIPVGGNSGVIFSVHEDTAYQATYLTGIEMQVLDDIKAEDNKKPNHLAGSLYDLYTPAHPAKPAGEWNAIEIKKLNGHLTFWMNGQKVVEAQIGSKEWNTLIKTSKYKDWKAWATFPKGHIALQDHGAAVAFRNIRIKQL